MKTIDVKVIPNARKNSVLEKDGLLIVKVNAPASDNKANKMLVEVLSGYLGVKKSDIRVIIVLQGNNLDILLPCALYVNPQTCPDSFVGSL